MLSERERIINWAPHVGRDQGLRIIKREDISTVNQSADQYLFAPHSTTPQVLNKMGDEVDVPDELLSFTTNHDTPHDALAQGPST